MKRIFAWSYPLLAMVFFALSGPTVHAQTPIAVTQSDCNTPNNSPVVGGTYPLGVNTLNQLCTTGGGGGGGGSNAAAGPTGTTVPTSGGYTAFNVGGNLVGVSAANPLPVSGTISATNPSVSTNNATAPTSSTQVGFLSGANLVSTSSANPLPVNVGNFPGTQAVTQSGTWSVNQGGTWNLNNIAGTVSLPTGAATSALQTTGNTSLSTLAGTVSAGNVNVVCTSGCAGGGGGSNAAAGLTGSAVPTSGGYTAFNVGGNLVGVSSSNPLPITGSISATNPSVSTNNAAAPASSTQIGFLSGSNLVSASTGNPLPVTVGNFPGTQPVSGTVAATQSGTWTINGLSGTVSLPTGAATAAKQPALGTAGIASTDVITVQGIASMTPLTVNGSGVTQPISASALPLPTGASTSALQTTGNTSLGTLAGTVSGGNINVVCTSGCSGGGGSNAAAGLTGSAVPTSGGYTAFSVGGTLTGVSSTNPLPVADSSVAQASTTSGQKAYLQGCAVTTSAPSYTTAQTNAQSCDTLGNTRVTDASVVAAIMAAALTPPLPITGTTTTAAQVTVTTGGTAQNLFGGVAPTNGYEVCDPNATGDLWLSETTTAAANSGYRVQANGGCYDTPVGSKPGGVVSVFGATTAMKISVKSW